MNKETEDWILLGLVLVSLYFSYYMFKTYFSSPVIEGLENKKTVIDKNLTVTSSGGLKILRTQNEAIGNEILLTNPEYNDNYSKMCTELYDIINLKMVKLAVSLDPTNDTVFIKGLTDLNTMSQSKLTLNEIVQFIDSIEAENNKK
jgi:hypothetical protein